MLIFQIASIDIFQNCFIGFAIYVSEAQATLPGGGFTAHSGQFYSENPIGGAANCHIDEPNPDETLY